MTEKVMNLPSPSIYEVIEHNLDPNLKLPREFSLRAHRRSPGEKLVYADGFMEGNLTGPDPGEETSQELLEILEKLRDKQFGEALKALNAFFDEDEELMNPLVGMVHEFIGQQDQAVVGDLIYFAKHLLVETDRIELVKFALTLLEYYPSEYDMEVGRQILDLAQCNEFTLFALRNMVQWDDSQEMIFELIQHVYGWGRIFAMEVLDPEPAEVQHWMLEQGWDNDVNPEYTALMIATDVKLDEVLRQAEKISEAAFRGASVLVEGLLQDEPIPGISEWPDPLGLLNHYLEQALERKLSWKEYQTIWHVVQFGEQHKDQPGMTGLVTKGGKLLTTFACAEVVIKAMEQGEGFELARALELPYHPAAEKLVREDPLGNVELLSYALTTDQLNNQELTGLYEKALPLEALAAGRVQPGGDELELELAYMQLAMVGGQLYGFPGVGEDLVHAALHCGNALCQEVAQQVEEQWHDLGWSHQLCN